MENDKQSESDNTIINNENQPEINKINPTLDNPLSDLNANNQNEVIQKKEKPKEFFETQNKQIEGKSKFLFF